MGLTGLQWMVVMVEGGFSSWILNGLISRSLPMGGTGQAQKGGQWALLFAFPEQGVCLVVQHNDFVRKSRTINPRNN